MKKVQALIKKIVMKIQKIQILQKRKRKRIRIKIKNQQKKKRKKEKKMIVQILMINIKKRRRMKEIIVFQKKVKIILLTLLQNLRDHNPV